MPTWLHLDHQGTTDTTSRQVKVHLVEIRKLWWANRPRCNMTQGDRTCLWSVSNCVGCEPATVVHWLGTELTVITKDLMAHRQMSHR